MAIQFLNNQYISGTLEVAGATTFDTVANPGSDTDKFVVINGSGLLGFRTGAELLADIGGSSSATTVTSVSGTQPIISSGGLTPTISLNYTGANNLVESATDLEGSSIATADSIIYNDATDGNVKKGLISDLPFSNTSGTVTSITPGADSGTGTAITTSGTITVAGGSNITTSVSGTTITVNTDFNQYGWSITDGSTTNSIPSGTTVTFQGGTGINTSLNGYILDIEIDSSVVPGGSGTAGKLTKWTATKTLGDGPVTISGSDALFDGHITLASDKKVNFGASSYIEGATSGSKLMLRSSDDMIFQPGSSTKVTFQANGNVGIGTGSPDAPLHILKAAGGANIVTALKLDPDDATVNSGTSIDFNASSTNTGASLVGSRIVGAREASNVDIYQVGIYHLDTSPDASGSVPLERMRVTSAGNVGIGTATPYAKLDVVNGTNNNEAANATDFRFVAANRAITTERANMEIYTNNAQAADLGGSIGFGGRHTDSSTNDSLFATIKAGKSNATTGNYLGYLEIGTSDAASDITRRFIIDSNGATFAGQLIIQSEYPTILLTDTNHNDDWGIYNNNGKFLVYNQTDAVSSLEIDQSNNATFAKNVAVGGGSVIDILGYGNTAQVLSVQGIKGSSSVQRPVVFNLAGQRDDGTDGYVSDINFLNMASNGTTVNSRAIIRMSRENTDNSNQLEFWTSAAGSTTKALTLDRSQNATFAGNVVIGTVDSVSTGLSIGEASPTIQLFDTTNDAKLLMYTQNNNSIIGTYSNHPMSFYTDSGETLTLNTDHSATFAGFVNLADTKQLRFGNSSDLIIYHDTNSFIQNATGYLMIRSDNAIYLRSNTGNNQYITCIKGGAVDLYYNDSKKFETTNTGATVTGAVTATTFSGDLNGTINTATTAVTKGNAVNDTTVATTAFVQNVIGTIPAGLVFQGSWNASTNTPTLASGSGTTGHFYIVSVAGSTNLDGVTDWEVGDWAVFIEQGASDQWEKIDNSSVLSGSGSGGSLAAWAGSGTSVTLTNAPVTYSGNNTTFAGDVLLGSSKGLYTNVVQAVSSAGLKLGNDDNSQYIFIKDDTGVGIGTTSPSASLEVSTANPRVKVTATTGTNPSYLNINNTGGSTYVGMESSVAGSEFTGTTAYASVFGSSGARDTQLLTSGTVRMTINSTGLTTIKRTGITGVTKNDMTLQIGYEGNNGQNNLIGFGYNAGSAIPAYIGYTTTSGSSNTKGAIVFGTRDVVTDSDPTERMRISSAGLVGIGTDAPQTGLHLYGTSNTASNFTIEQVYSGTSKKFGFQPVYNDDRLDFWYNSNATVAMTIKDGGNVGIGTTTPLSKLTVSEGTSQHGVEIAPGTLSYIQAYDRATSTYGNLTIDAKYIAFGLDNGAEKIRFTASGNVGIGTTLPIQKLDTPNIVIGGSTIAGTYRANALFMDNNGGNSRFYSSGADGSTKGSYEFNIMASDANPLSTPLKLNADDSATFAGTVSISTATTYPLTVKSTDADAADIFRVLADDDGLVASVHKDASDNGELYVWSGAQAANIQLFGGTGNATFAGTVEADLFKVEQSNTSTNVTASSDYGIWLKNTSDTDGNFIPISFSNSTGFETARIGAEFQDAGDRNTDLFFMTRANGGVLTEQLRISSTGAATFEGKILASNDAPAFAFASDTETGMARTGTHQIAFKNNDVDSLTLAADLSATFGGTIGSGAITSTGRVTGTQGYFGDCYMQTDGGYAVYGSDSSSVPIAIALNGTASSAALKIETNNNATFAGDVAINTTTSPAKNLVVEGNASQYATIRVLSNSTGHGSEIEFGDSTDADYGSITQFASSSGEGGRMRFRAGGTETMNLSNGNVGIGTTLPIEKLQVTGQLISTGSNATSATAGAERAIMDLSAYSATDHSARFGHFRGTESAGAGQLRLYTDSIERVRIDASGNVGINVANPSARLEVSGGAKLGGGGFYVSTDSTFLTNYSYTFRDSVGILNVNGVSAATATTAMSIGQMSNGVSLVTTGSVGIGTGAIPSNRLQVSDTGNLVCRYTGGSTFSLYQNNTDGTVIFSQDHGDTASENRFIWQTGGGVEQMRIDTSNASLLTVAGGIQLGNGGGGGYLKYNTGNLYIQGTSNIVATFESTGDVGIGTTSPATKLHVYANAEDAQGVAYIEQNNASNNPTMVIQHNTAGGNANSNTGLVIKSAGSGAGNQNVFHAYQENGSDTAMVIKGSSAVGIGTTLPRAKGLEIFRAAGSSSNPQLIISTGESSSKDYGISTDVAGAGDFAIVDGVTNVAANVRLLINSAGKVGIGTTSPGAKLEVTTSTAGFASIIQNTNGASDANGLLIKAGTVASEYSLKVSNSTDSTNFMVVKGNGNVGIGNTAPANKLHVTTSTGQSARFEATGQYTSLIEFKSLGTAALPSVGAAGDDYVVWTNGAERMRISSAGKTAINHATSNRTLVIGGALDVQGTLYKTSGSFAIDHPLESKKDTHKLIHSFIEGPKADNIYRGKAQLKDGSVVVNLDTVSEMTEGTFVLLNRDVQCFTSNESDWDPVKGTIEGSLLTISCKNTSSNAMISWMVVGERQDKEIKESELTDDNGKIIVEPTIEEFEK